MFNHNEFCSQEEANQTLSFSHSGSRVAERRFQAASLYETIRLLTSGTFIICNQVLLDAAAAADPRFWRHPKSPGPGGPSGGSRRRRRRGPPLPMAGNYYVCVGCPSGPRRGQAASFNVLFERTPSALRRKQREAAGQTGKPAAEEFFASPGASTAGSLSCCRLAKVPLPTPQP